MIQDKIVGTILAWSTSKSGHIWSENCRLPVGQRTGWSKSLLVDITKIGTVGYLVAHPT